VFGRRKAPPTPQSSAAPEGPGKNRPTPRRREAEAARKQPLVPAGRGATGAKGPEGKAARQAAREERVHARERMMAGEERYLAARDRGPVRRFARDSVDTRWNVGELLLPLMLVVLVLSFVASPTRNTNPVVYTVVLAMTYTLVVLAVLDGLVLARRIKRGLQQRFGADVDASGIGRYAVLRAFQVRRTRIPRPAIKRGDPPT
jgi:Protein of unknown function (DUF3043)